MGKMPPALAAYHAKKNKGKEKKPEKKPKKKGK